MFVSIELGNNDITFIVFVCSTFYRLQFSAIFSTFNVRGAAISCTNSRTNKLYDIHFCYILILFFLSASHLGSLNIYNIIFKKLHNLFFKYIV